MRSPLLPTLLLRRLSLMLPLLLLASHAVQARERPALQLLRPNDAKNRTGLVLVESTLAYIEALHSPVAVVGIVGSYHTGKSFLLNQVARSLSTAAPEPTDLQAAAETQQEVFTIGRGVDPETSGELTTGQWEWEDVGVPSIYIHPSAHPY